MNLLSIFALILVQFFFINGSIRLEKRNISGNYL